MVVNKKNIFLTQTSESMPYMSSPSRGGGRIPEREVGWHASFIHKKLTDCYNESLTQKQVAAIKYKSGTYLEFSSASEYDLTIKSLENRSQGIYLLNVQEDKDTQTIKATVYIPEGKESYFIKKIEDYADESKNTKSGNPKNNNLVASIEDIKVALLDSFWVGQKDCMPKDTPEWCEIWLRYDYKADDKTTWKVPEEDLNAICQSENIMIDEKRIIFPERIVKLVRANSEQLQCLISRCDFISEIRHSQEAVTFFEDLNNSEQKEWTQELLSRTVYSKEGVSVCLLDTGINSGHSLLAPSIENEHIQAINSSWGVGDHQGHGTEMAGLVLFNDLKEALLSKEIIRIPHELESIKILPPRGQNEPDLYGALTEQAVSLAEIANPEANRAICMAVTSPNYNTFDGSPTSWSAAIDSITSGADEEEEKDYFY